MLINDKSQLKRNVEQIGSQLALKTSKAAELHVMFAALNERGYLLWWHRFINPAELSVLVDFFSVNFSVHSLQKFS